MSLALGTYLDILCSFSDVTSDKDLNQLKQQNGNKSDDQKKQKRKWRKRKKNKNCSIWSFVLILNLFDEMPWSKPITIKHFTILYKEKILYAIGR